MDNLQKLISISSGIKEIDKAKKLGFINMDIVNLYQTYAYYLDFTKDKEIFEKENVELWNKIEELQLSYSGKLCTFKAKLPSTFDSFTDDEITSGSGLVKPVVGSFTITDFSQQTLFGSGATYSTHNFTQAEFEAVYSDQDNDTAFYALVIYRNKPRRPGPVVSGQSPTMSSRRTRHRTNRQARRTRLGDPRWCPLPHPTPNHPSSTDLEPARIEPGRSR